MLKSKGLDPIIKEVNKWYEFMHSGMYSMTSFCRYEFVGRIFGMALLYNDPLSVKLGTSTAKLLANTSEVPDW